MRIAIVGPYFWPHGYGIEKIMYAHAKHLSERGHDVLVITSQLQYPRGIDRTLLGFERHRLFDIRRLTVLLRTAPPYICYPSRGGLIVLGLQGALIEFRPDIVHAHNIGAASWSLLSAQYAQKTNTSFFFSPHYHPGRLKFDAARKWLLRKLNRLPIRSARKIYHPTLRDFNLFPRDYSYAPIERFSVLVNGVEPPGASLRLPDRGQKLNVLFVGRVEDPRKGFAVLEAAVDACSADIRERFTLRIVGAISDATSTRLREKYRDAVQLLGPVSEVELERAYSEADIFIMPSRYEGFGMPYVEAMRYGVPVIGTTAGGIPEVVPGDAGILVDPGDVAGVSAALRRLIADADLRRTMGAFGVEWSKRFHWSRVVDELEADYYSARTETRQLVSS